MRSKGTRVVLACTAALACTTAAAGAATVSTDDLDDNASGEVRFVAGPGEVNGLTITQPDDLHVRFADAGAGVTVLTDDDDCEIEEGAKAAVCEIPGVDSQSQDVDVQLGDGDDSLVADLTTIRLDADGDDGNDKLTGSNTPLTDGLDDFSLGDFLRGGAGNDLVQGRGGPDFIEGSIGDDGLDGGDGGDLITDHGFCTTDVDGPCPSYTSSGNDIVVGGDGADELYGETGNDQYFGGRDADFIQDESPCTFSEFDEALEHQVCKQRQPSGADDFDGGEGPDGLSYSERETSVSVNLTTPGAVQGESGEGDSVTGIEDVIGGRGNDALTGDRGFNTLVGGTGDDRLEGGPGGDMVHGGNFGFGVVNHQPTDGNDTLLLADDDADRATCGSGGDTVDADDIDQLATDCEAVARRASVQDDPGPTVSFVLPAAGARIDAGKGVTLAATAGDIRGTVAKVVFLDDGAPVCEDTTAPYTCAYRPKGDDVGRNTLAAVAVDDRNQIGTAFRNVEVTRFVPGALTLKVKRKGRTFRTTGTLRLPAGVTRARGCGEGLVSVQVKNGSKTISTRRVSLSRTCTFRSTVLLRSRSRSGARPKFTVRFLGNEVLTRSAARSRRVSAR